MAYLSKILVVDDSELNRLMLCDILEDKYELLEARNGREALKMVDEHAHDLALILLDYNMPEMNGFELMSLLNERGWKAQIPVIMISAETGADFIDKAYDLGVDDFISRPFNISLVMHRVDNAILLNSKQKYMEHLVDRQIREKEKQSEMLINILSHIVEFRNNELGRHVLNVRTVSEMLLRELREIDPGFTMSDEQIRQIGLASSLHDVGKISIDEKILNKPGRLTAEEFEIIKTHTTIGAQMLEKVPNCSGEPLVQTAIDIARWHHERYDGNGYPDHLIAEQIPLSAQVVSIADVYDALTEERVYKKAIPRKDALEMIATGQCGAFSPKLLECLMRLETKLDQIELLSGTNHTSVDSFMSERIDSAYISEQDMHGLEYEREKYGFYATHSQEIRFEYTKDPSVITFSRLACDKLGLDQVIIDPLHDLRSQIMMDRETKKRLNAELEKVSSAHPDMEMNLALQTGHGRRWFRLIARAIFNEEECTGYFGLLIDIHDEKLDREILEYSANYDSLTGIRNRSCAINLINKQLNAISEDHMALIMIDLDNFKNANDEFGHQFGDDVLRYFASMIKNNIRSDDIGARIGGDEFLIFLRYHSNLENIVARLHRSLQYEYRGFPVSTSMGVASTETCPPDLKVLYREADKMLYDVKKTGRASYKIKQAENRKEKEEKST